MLDGYLRWTCREPILMVRTNSHIIDCFDFDISRQEVGIEGREEHHRRRPLLVKGCMI